MSEEEEHLVLGTFNMRDILRLVEYCQKHDAYRNDESGLYAAGRGGITFYTGPRKERSRRNARFSGKMPQWISSVRRVSSYSGKVYFFLTDEDHRIGVIDHTKMPEEVEVRAIKEGSRESFKRTMFGRPDTQDLEATREQFFLALERSSQSEMEVE